MSDVTAHWAQMLEQYGRESNVRRAGIKARDYASGRAILDAAPDARAWFLLETWRLNGQAWRGGTHPHLSSMALMALSRELLRPEMFCTPEQMQRIIWQADLDDLTPGLLTNIERHREHFGMTPEVHKMLEIKRIELARIARNKKDRARLERIDALLGRRPETQ